MLAMSFWTRLLCPYPMVESPIWVYILNKVSCLTQVEITKEKSIFFFPMLDEINEDIYLQQAQNSFPFLFFFLCYHYK